MFDQVLVPLDGSALAECALPHAATFSRAFAAPIRVLHVLERPPAPAQAIDPLGWHVRRVEAQTYINPVVQRLTEAGFDADGCVVEGNVAEQIVGFARDEGVDLIALSSHGNSGLRRWNVSSIVQKVIQHAGTSVLVVRAYQETPALEGSVYRRIMVPLDRSPRAESGLWVARMLAQNQSAELMLVHAVHRPERARSVPLPAHVRELVEELVTYDQQEATHYFEGLCAQLALRAETRVVLGSSVPALLHMLANQEAVDLIILTAHGHVETSIRPYGSVPLNLITYGSTPLLVVQDVGELGQGESERAALQFQGH